MREPIQAKLFDDAEPALEATPGDARRSRSQAAVDQLRRRYGRGSVVPASLLGRQPLRGADGTEGAPERRLPG